MKKILFLFFLISFSFAGLAQKDSVSLTRKEKRQIKKSLFLENNDAFKSAAVFVNQGQFQDTRMSPLIFSTWGTGLDAKYLRFGKKAMKYRQFRLHYQSGKVSELPDKYMQMGKVEYSYGLHKKIPLPLGSLYLGGSINNMLNIRVYSPLGNNALAADNSFSLAPTFFWINEKTIFKRPCYIALQGGFNLVNVTLRYPQFAYTGIESQVLIMNNYNRFFMELQFVPRLKNSKENHFNISYVFDVYTFSSANDDKRIAGYFNGLKFGYWLKTK